MKRNNQKRGKWLSPKIVLGCNHAYSTVTLPGANGRTISAATEDVREALSYESFSAKIRQVDDKLDDEIQDLLLHLSSKHVKFSADDENPGTDISPPTHEGSSIYADVDLNTVPKFGDHIEVCWPLDNQYYHG